MSTNPRTRPRPLPRRPRRLAAALAFPLVGALLALLAGGCGIGGGSPRDSGVVATLPPAPADTPLDLERADKLWHDGDIDGAEEIYSAVAQRGSGLSQQNALESLARLTFDEGRPEQAATALNMLLEQGPPAEQEARAQLLLGAVEQRLNDPAAAEEAYTAYIESGGPAASLARLRLAEVVAQGGDEERAIELLETALGDGLAPEQETQALTVLAHNLDAADRDEDALETWQRLTEEAATGVARGDALWELAQLAGRLGEDEQYQTALVILARDLPWHPRALESLSLPQRAAAPALGELERALVLFNGGTVEEARAAYEGALEGSLTRQGRADAYLHLALLAEREEDNDAALAQYAEALKALQGSESDPFYGEVLWERALLYEGLGRVEEAIADYAAIAELSPDAAEAPEAGFRAGLLRYRQGNLADAATYWSRYAEIAEGEDAARANFWLAKVALASGDTLTANARLADTEVGGEWDYYAMRAAALTGETAPIAATEPVREPQPPDWRAVETWLGMWVGPEPVATADATPVEGTPQPVPLDEDPAWLRGRELARAGLRIEARDQFFDLVNEAAGEPWKLYRLTRAFVEEGETELAARAATRLVGERSDAPPDILRVAYPAAWLDLITPLAEEGKFAPLLMLALIRQESFFWSQAESVAGALGLTQVVPPTADEIASDLGREGDFTYGDLLRPIVSLEFGAHYLAEQLALFEGDVSAALAAYNGGPGNALRWREEAPDDADLFLESITLSETRAYVELVLEHYARYRYAYGLADGPVLPLQ